MRSLIISALFVLLLPISTSSLQPPPEPEPEPVIIESAIFEATAYSMGEITKSGLPVDAGIVATDPAVIPLGSVVWVEGYGYAYCADTGGKIKGKRIDVYMASETEALKWGRRQVEVRVIRRGD